MRIRKIIVTGALLTALLLGITACEDTDVTAPEGSTITLTPTPGTVLIDQAAGEEEGNTTLVAQVVGSSGLPIDGIPLFFSTDGGLLGTVDNLCQNNSCSLSGAQCGDDTPCPNVPPLVLETNSNGVVTDVLTLRLFQDPDTVTVTVRGTNLETTAAVGKTVNVGPADPIALIVVDPPNGQRGGLPFALDGTGSTFDPQVEPTCWEWLITEENGVENVFRGPNESIIPAFSLGVADDPASDQDITIQLRVSDEDDIFCHPNIAPDDEDFSFNADVISYQVRCDFTPPTVLQIGDETRSLAGDGNGNSVSITFEAIAFDPESPDDPLHPSGVVEGLMYNWVCDNADETVQNGPNSTVSCTYTNIEDDKNASVTVSNRCGLTTSRGFSVTILP